MNCLDVMTKTAALSKNGGKFRFYDFCELWLCLWFWERLKSYSIILPLLNQQEVGRVVEITDNHKLFWSRAVEIDAFLASFDKSKGITSCRRRFPEGYVLRSRACEGKNALFIVILKKKTHLKGHVILSSFLTSFALSFS